MRNDDKIKYETAKLLRDYTPTYANCDLRYIIALHEDGLRGSGLTWGEFKRSMTVYLSVEAKRKAKRSAE
jgi:hypothetical protein